MVNQQQVTSQQPKVKQQVPSQLKGRQQHWAQRVISIVSTVASVAFALGNAHSIYWFYSAMNQVDWVQPVVTGLFAVAFVLTSFVLSRALPYRLQQRRRGLFDVVLFVVFCVALLFEMVEVACCFAEAAYSVHFMTWITDGGFTGILSNVLHVLPYLILPITPVLGISLGFLDVVLHH
jgi:hypothetical protein